MTMTMTLTLTLTLNLTLNLTFHFKVVKAEKESVWEGKRAVEQDSKALQEELAMVTKERGEAKMKIVEYECKALASQTRITELENDKKDFATKLSEGLIENKKLSEEIQFPQMPIRVRVRVRVRGDAIPSNALTPIVMP